MSTRLQLNRSLSLHLNGLSKDGQTNSSLDNQGANLSPSIQPDIQSFSSLIKLSQQCSIQANSSNEELSSNRTIQTDSSEEISQKCSTKGDFLLLESSPLNECFNSAINKKNQKFYYWKVSNQNFILAKFIRDVVKGYIFLPDYRLLITWLLK